MKSALSILYFAYFYLAWFACVGLAKQGLSTASLLLVIPVAIYAWVKLNFSLKIWLRALLLAFFGFVFDYAMSSSRLVTFFYSENSFLLPIWLISLWLLYLGYLPVMAALFTKQRMIAALVGAIFGPLSYLSGERLGMLAFARIEFAALYSIFWGAHFLFSVYLLNSHDKSKTRTEV